MAGIGYPHPRTLSDHSPVVVTLKIPIAGGMESRWQFPNMALKDEVFRTELQLAIIEYFKLNKDSVPIQAPMWKAFKAYTRICISKHAGVLCDLPKTLARIKEEIGLLDCEATRTGTDAQLPRQSALLAEFGDAAERETYYVGKYAKARQ